MALLLLSVLFTGKGYEVTRTEVLCHPTPPTQRDPPPVGRPLRGLRHHVSISLGKTRLCTPSDGGLGEASLPSFGNEIRVTSVKITRKADRFRQIQPSPGGSRHIQAHPDTSKHIRAYPASSGQLRAAPGGTGQRPDSWPRLEVRLFPHPLPVLWNMGAGLRVRIGFRR
jgi:hypothetical protein